MRDLGSGALPPIALRVFETLPAKCVVLSPQLTILTASNRYLTLTGRTREEITGQHFFHVFPELWDSFQENEHTMRASLQQVLKNKMPHEIPLLRYDIPDRADGHSLKETYCQIIHQPVLDEGSEIAYIIHEVRDVSRVESNELELKQLNNELNQAYQELQASHEEVMTANEELSATNEELQQTQEALAMLNENLEDKIRERTAELTDAKHRLEELVSRLATSEQKVRSLVESAPFPIGVYTGREMRIDLLNQAIIDAWNRGSDLIGKTYAEVLPELAGTGVYEQLDRVYTTGIPYHTKNERVDFLVDGELRSFYFNYDFTPLFDGEGNVYGVMNTAADVTELVNAKLQVEQSEKSLLNIIMRSPVSKCILIGPEYIVAVANDRVIELWGKSRADVMNKPLFDGLPDAKGQGLEDLLMQVYTTGITFEAQERPVQLLRNGSLQTVYLNFVYQPFRDAQDNIIGVIATAIDVSSHVKAREVVQQLNEELAATNEELQAANEEQSAVNEELATLNEALKVSQDELELAIDAAALGTWDYNPATGRFSGNSLTKSWFGLRAEEEIELSDAINTIIEADRERVMAAIMHALRYESGGNYQTDYTLVHPVTNIMMEVRAKGRALFDEARRPIRLSGILQDVTEQKRDEQRKNDFIGIVSHELKTPLTSIKALLQVAARKLTQSDDAFLKGSIEKSNIQVKKMETMISGFLNVSRLESGKMQIDKSLFDFEELLEDSIREAELTLSTHRIDFLACGPVPVEADQDKISLVMSNLLSNAIKYSPNGERIEVRCEVLGDFVQVSVKDEGFGIQPADKEKLFERYYRVETSNTKHISGFGIGLYLCSHIIERHEGQIWVESTVGEGSTFFFRLPLGR